MSDNLALELVIAHKRIDELERQLKAAHEFLDERLKNNIRLSKEIIRLGGEAPPWDVTEDSPS